MVIFGEPYGVVVTTWFVFPSFEKVGCGYITMIFDIICKYKCPNKKKKSIQTISYKATRWFWKR